MSLGSVSTRDAEGAADSFVREARIGARFGWISTAAWIVLGMDSILRPVLNLCGFPGRGEASSSLVSLLVRLLPE
jgi:hypothetical protein